MSAKISSKLMLIVLTAFISSSAIAAVCTWPNGHQLGMGLTFAYGPTVASYVAGNPAIQTAIYQGRDVWDSTDAIDRIGDHDGNTATSDCPAVAQTAIIGAFAFTGSNCATSGTGNSNYLAVADVWTGVACTQPTCNTKSIVVNLDHAWVINGAPMANQFDLISMIAHEFGHVLGFAHQASGVCTSTAATGASCASITNMETMYPVMEDGDNCQATLEANDSQSANSYYP